MSNAMRLLLQIQSYKSRCKLFAGIIECLFGSAVILSNVLSIGFYNYEIKIL